MRQGARTCAAAAGAGLLFLLSAADATQPRLRDVERRRAPAESDRKRLEAEARAAATRIDALSRQLNAARAERRAAEAEVARLERSAGELLSAERAADAEARAATARLETSLIALSLPQRDGRASLIAAAAGERLAARATRARRVAALARAERVDLGTQRAELAVAEARLDSADARLRTLIAEQQARRAILNADASRAGSRAAALAQQARSIRDLVARTTKAAATRVSPRTAAAAPSTPSRAQAVAARFADGATVRRRFGERLERGAAQGLTLALPARSVVRAPSAAKVVWAGPFRSYGRVLILDPGEDCAIVLTGMGTILVREGETVEAGRPIAQMALDATTAPELYVEVRRSGDPIDPVPWLHGRR